MDIYKIVVTEAGTLNSEIFSRIYFDRAKAMQAARELAVDGDSVRVYRETPDRELGFYRTIDISAIK